MSDKAKYSYLAGIIDGRGCLTIEVGSKGSVTGYDSFVAVANTDERLIKWLQNNFGGNYYKADRKVPNSKLAYIWRYLKHTEVERLLLAILPYLIIKREQAILLLSFVRLPRMDCPAKREEMYQQMKVLNKRGTDNVTTNMQDGSEFPKIESEHTGDRVSGPTVT